MATTLLTAQDVNWNIKRGAFNILVDQQPAGIAVPRSADEVSDVVRSAAADGKRVAAQRTGHNAVPLGSLANTVLVRTAALGGVQIDAEAAVPESGPAHFGRMSCPRPPSWVLLRCTARLQMSALSATPSVAGSVSTIANTASPATG